MAIAAAIVLYAVIWFLCLFIVLPIRITTQSEAGRIIPGTPSSAPSNPKLLIRVKYTTMLATIIWAIVCIVIVTDTISIVDLDIFNRWQQGYYG